jgi:hypothetical protein
LVQAACDAVIRPEVAFGNSVQFPFPQAGSKWQVFSSSHFVVILGAMIAGKAAAELRSL